MKPPQDAHDSPGHEGPNPGSPGHEGSGHEGSGHKSPRPETPPSKFAVRAGLVGVQLAFAGHAVASKKVLENLDASALALIRASSAWLFLLIWVTLRSGFPVLPRRDLALTALGGLLGIAANQLLFFHGLTRTTAINASVLVTTIPVFTLLVSAIAGREKLRGRGLWGIGLAFSGVLYLLGAQAISLGSDTLIGDAMVVSNALSYGIYLVVIADVVRRHGFMVVMVWVFFFGALWVFPFGIGPLLGTEVDWSAEVIGLTLYIVLVATLFTYVVNAWTLRYAPPSTVAIYIYLQPFGATILAIVLLDEMPSSRIALAALLVFAGIYLVTSRAVAPKKEAAG